MRILVTGRAIPHQPGRCTGERLVEGFKQAGHEAYFYGCPHGDWMNFLGAKECQEIDRWDLVVYTEMNDGGPGYETLFEYYKLKNVPKLYWDFDASYNWTYAQQRAGAFPYDGYLVGNKHYLERFEKRFGKPVLHITYACSPQWERSLDPAKIRPYLIGFVGSATDERQRLLELIKNTMYNKGAFLHREGVYGDELIQVTNQMKIMFHCNQDACKGLVPGRPWEASACGTTLMMDRAAYDDFTQFLDADQHEYLLVYDTDDDIRRLVKYWQEKPAELGMMGDSLGTYIRNNHSYKQRAEEIIRWTQSLSLVSESES